MGEQTNGAKNRLLDGVVGLIFSILSVAALKLLSLVFTSPVVLFEFACLILLAGIIGSVWAIDQQKASNTDVIIFWIGFGLAALLLGGFFVFDRSENSSAAVTGRIVTSETVSLTLKDSSGVPHVIEFSQEGRFDVSRVPQGSFTIAIDGTNRLVYEGAVSSGWERIVSSSIDIGALVIADSTSPCSTGYPGCEKVTTNAQWTPLIQEFAGVDMVLVPAGCFAMGGDGDDSDQTCLDQPFWMDRFEVTNAQFVWFGGVASNDSHWPDAIRPREQILWSRARDFCARRDAQLPSEAQWEYAARGPDNLIYPWGNAFDGSRVNFCDRNCEFDWRDARSDDGYPYTAPVGSFRTGASWVGAYDLSGNVWEWTESGVLRGGSFGDSLERLSATFRNEQDSGEGSDDDGFRCVRAYQP